MGRGDWVHLAVCRSQSALGLAHPLFCDAACLGERHVCLHLAFFRQCTAVGMVGNAAGSNDGGGKLHGLRSGLVDLATGRKSR